MSFRIEETIPLIDRELDFTLHSLWEKPTHHPIDTSPVVSLNGVVPHYHRLDILTTFLANHDVLRSPRRLSVEH